MKTTVFSGTGVSCGLAILSSLFTRTNFHVEDALLGAYNIMTYGAPKIWYAIHASFVAIIHEPMPWQSRCVSTDVEFR